MAVSVLIGGRTVEIAFDEWPFYREHLRLIPALWLGGMGTHGSCGAGGVAIFALQHRKPLLRLADALVIPAAFLMGIGRLGSLHRRPNCRAVTEE